MTSRTESGMEGLFPTLRVLSWLVLLLMLVALGYTCIISFMHWSGIGV